MSQLSTSHRPKTKIPYAEVVVTGVNTLLQCEPLPFIYF